MSSLPQPLTEEGRIVGAIGGVRGRIQGLILFGSNQLFQAYFEAFLKGATYPAAAIEIQAKKAGLKLPGKEDPEKTLARITKEATELLQNMQQATYRKDRMEEGEVGNALLFRTPKGNRGRAIGVDDQMVYLAAFVHDPFENAFYGTALEVPNPEDLEDPTRPGIAELERRARNPGQRLTEFEKRLLERLRKAPGASGRAPGAPVPGPRVPRGPGSGTGGGRRR